MNGQDNIIGCWTLEAGLAIVTGKALSKREKWGYPGGDHIQGQTEKTLP